MWNYGNGLLKLTAAHIPTKYLSYHTDNKYMPPSWFCFPCSLLHIYILIYAYYVCLTQSHYALSSS